MKQKHKKSEYKQTKTLASKAEEPLSKKFLFLSHLLIIVLGFVAYANSFNGEFLYDDISLIQNNPLIREPFPITSFFTKSIAASTELESNFYRPLQMVSYKINYAFCQLDVTGYHLTNVFLHILVALCIYWLIVILFSNNALALITAVLFIIHPIHTEAVSYIAGRADSLASFFLLLCMIVYVRRPDQKPLNVMGHLLLLVVYACALFSKEYSLILPFILLFYHGVFKKKIELPTFLSIAGVAIIYTIVRVVSFKSFLQPLSADTVFDRVPGLFVAILSYIKLLFFPFRLHMEYGSKLFGWAEPKVIVGFILTLGILILGYLKRGNKIIFFSLGWFFLTLFPVMNLYKINAFMAEHFLYLPSMGFFLAIAYGFNLLYNDKKYRIGALILIATCSLFYLTLTIKQNRYWQDHLTFYKKTLEFVPDSARIYYNLGKLYLDKGNVMDAVTGFSKAIDLDPSKFEAYINRGISYCRIDNYERAMLDFNKSIELRPNFAKAYFNRGIAYSNKGHYDQALLDLNKAIELDAQYSLAYSNRATLHIIRKEYSFAWKDIHKAMDLGVKFDPRLLETLKKVSGGDNQTP